MLTIRPRVAATVAIPDTGEKTLFLDQSDSVLKTKDDAGVVESLATADTVQDALDAQAATEPKVYVALLTQSGTDAPVATVLENTLGGTIVWSYTDVGVYTGTLASAFTANKTACFVTINEQNDSENFIILGSASVNTVTVQSLSDGTNTNGLAITSIKIELYP